MAARTKIPIILVTVIVGLFCSVLVTLNTHRKTYAKGLLSSTEIEDLIITNLKNATTTTTTTTNTTTITTTTANITTATMEVMNALKSKKIEYKFEATTSVNANNDKYKFAYAFLIAGINPKSPSYKGYIYSVAVAKNVLSRLGSTNDVIVMIRMHRDIKDEKLPKEDEEILNKSGIIVKYLPKARADNFHTAMMDKFRILQYVEYDRILYLDADVTPLNNLDYVFDMSVGPDAVFQENLAIAYNNEPTNGGFFMLSPNEGDYESISKIIEKREREGYHFNATIGWGHIMQPPDEWESLSGKQGSMWTFYGAFTDQGLIYHWTKYVKKKVTIINGGKVKTFQENDKGEIYEARVEDGVEIFKHVTKTLNVGTTHHTLDFTINRRPPYRDFHHFKERFKPWVKTNKPYIDHGPHEFWFYILGEINDELELGIDIGKVELKKPDLGLFPTYNMVQKMKELREEEDEGQN